MMSVFTGIKSKTEHRIEAVKFLIVGDIVFQSTALENYTSVCHSSQIIKSRVYFLKWTQAFCVYFSLQLPIPKGKQCQKTNMND